MRPRTLFTLAIALFAAVSMQAADLTVDEILAKNAEAKGGIDKLRALESIRFTGKMTLGGGMEAPIVMSKKRPEMMRMDFTVQGMTGSQAYDGTGGWMLMPFMGKKEAEPMSGDMLKEVKETFEIEVVCHGSGIGLWIAQQIITGHGGTIEAINGPQGGAIFTVYLPAERRA